MLQKYFWPQPDITAFELAFILSRIATSPIEVSVPLYRRAIKFSVEHWDGLPPNIKKQFSDGPAALQWGAEWHG